MKNCKVFLFFFIPELASSLYEPEPIQELDQGLAVSDDLIFYLTL